MGQKILENQDPSHKVGVKYLDERQIENTFPDYPALLERIRDQRQIADYVARLPKKEFEHRQTQMYDNVYAILGGRGTGKSSVLLTLREQLQKESNGQDIIFPIITPEVIIGNNCSIIGWIMSVAEEMVTQIERRIQAEADKNSRLVSDMLMETKMDFFKDCHFHKGNKLREHYQALMRDCIQDDIPLSSYSFDEMVGLRVHLSHKHYNLIQKLNSFWYEMADSWRLLNKVEKMRTNQETAVSQPLLILLFDDIDLVPERSMELLSTTFQYFTNPNIVLVLTAAEKMLKRVIWMKMLERLSGSNYNSLLVDFFQKQTVQMLVESERGNEQTEGFSLAFVDRMEMEYYDKVIPPSSRFYLRRFRTISERRHYRYASTGQSFDIPEDNDSKPLGDFLIQQIDELTGQFSDGLPRKNFLVGKNKEMREAYFLMFGDKNRSISNGCLGFLNCISRLKRLAEKKQGDRFTELERSKIVTVLRHLLQTLLLSKNEVAEFREDVDRFLYQRGPERDVFVDYQRIWRIYLQKREALRSELQGERQKLQDQFSNEPAFNIENYINNKELDNLGTIQRQLAILFVMLLFAENLWITLEPVCYDGGRQKQKKRKLEKRRLGGSRELTSLLNADVFGLQELNARTNILGPFKPFSTRQSAEELLDRSPLLLEHIRQYVGFRPLDLSYAQIYLMDTFYAVIQANKGVDTDRLEAFMQDGLEEDWARSVLKMLFIRYSGITFIKKDFISFCRESRRRLGQVTVGGWLNEEIQNILLTSIKSGVFMNMDITPTIMKIRALGNKPQTEGSQREDLRMIWDQIFSNKTLSIFDIHQQFERWPIESTDKLLDIFIYYSWTLWPHRQIAIDPLVMIVDFVEGNINTVSQFLRNECHIKLSSKKLEQILEILDNIPEVSDHLRKKREETEMRLREFSIAQAANVNQKNTEETIEVPIKVLSDYLYELQDFLFYRENVTDEYDEFLSYYRSQMIHNYFSLSDFMVPFAPEVNRILYRPSVLRDKAIAEADSFILPCNLWFVLELRMIAKLMSVYFAAKFELSYGNMFLNDSSLLPDVNGYPQESSVDATLRKLYDSLTDCDGEKRLHKTMLEVSKELTDRYIAQLGGI